MTELKLEPRWSGLGSITLEPLALLPAVSHVQTKCIQPEFSPGCQAQKKVWPVESLALSGHHYVCVPMTAMEELLSCFLAKLPWKGSTGPRLRHVLHMSTCTCIHTLILCSNKKVIPQHWIMEATRLSPVCLGYCALWQLLVEKAAAVHLALTFLPAFSLH